eukprot:TRINITY_DN2312_c0_g1_i1.p1 TRINITY_DN2312_c0_g1~~TRINITY_DN2312_c0_g1_i1.p1  ORF type:complete len:235 (+),score=64.75 TRINITY_DN2312_c0_g1_i1:115-819(+)
MSLARLKSFSRALGAATPISRKTAPTQTGLFAAASSRWFHQSSRLRAEEEKTAEQNREESEQPAAEKADPNDPNVKIEALKKEAEELKNKLLYQLAESENTRRISKIEIDKARDFGIQSFAKSLLDTADNFTRCLQNAKKEELEANPAFKAFYEGVEMTEKIMQKAFQKNGLERFEPSTEKFDPNTMNALMFMPAPGKENGFVGAVLKPGYMLNKRVIRAADVGVVKNPQPDEE